MEDNTRRLQLEILEYNYWECFKAAKDLSLILSVDHPKRKAIEEQMKETLTKIQELKKKL